jgi:hypothetical protein
MEDPPHFALSDIVRFRPDYGVSLNLSATCEDRTIALEDLGEMEIVLIKAWMRGIDQKLDKKVVQANMTPADWQKCMKNYPNIDITKFDGKDGFWASYLRQANNKGFSADIPVDDEDIEAITSSLKGFAISPPVVANNIVDEAKVVTGSKMVSGLLTFLVKWKFPPKEFEKLATLLSMMPEEILTERWVKCSDLPSLDMTPQKKNVTTEEQKNEKLLNSVKKKLEMVCFDLI